MSEVELGFACRLCGHFVTMRATLIEHRQLIPCPNCGATLWFTVREPRAAQDLQNVQAIAEGADHV